MSAYKAQLLQTRVLTIQNQFKYFQLIQIDELV